MRTMAVIFDTHTQDGWRARGVSAVVIALVEGGCSGFRIRVEEVSAQNIPPEVTLLGVCGEVACYAHPKWHTLLQNARITQVGTKWILASAEAKNHCKCGSSFSLDTQKQNIPKKLILSPARLAAVRAQLQSL